MRHAYLLLFVALAACRKPDTQKNAPSPSAAPKEVALRTAEDGPTLRFAIETQHAKQRPVDHPPWHEPGGDWTFADARTDDGTRFGFGVSLGTPDRELAFGSAMLTVPDAEQGARLVSRFAKVFAGRATTAHPRQPLHFEPFDITILGKDGSLTSTKLFLHRSGLEAEVFFDFDLDHGQGAFAEKDSDYADDLVAWLARELRDGPEPRRTAATDSQIADHGPHVDGFLPFGKPRARFESFSDDGQLLFSTPEGDGTRLFGAVLAKPESERELLRLEHALGIVRCTARLELCLVEEILNERPNLISSEDPRRIWLVEPKASRVLEGPWEPKASIVSKPYSPRGEYLALAGEAMRSDAHGSFTRLYFMPRSGAAPVVPELGETFADVIGWTGSGPKLRALVSTGFRSRGDQHWFAVDPRTGSTQALPEKPAQADASLSPDGKLSVGCDLEQGTLTVTTLATKAARTFNVHDDERRTLEEPCASFADARFLLFGVEPYGLIDTRTMKLSYPIAEREKFDTVHFDPTLRYAVGARDSGLFVGLIAGVE